MPFTSNGHFKALIPYCWGVIIVGSLIVNTYYFLYCKDLIVN